MVKKKKSTRQRIGEMLFVGCLFIGLGLGMLFRQVAAGVLIGLGVGFIATFLFTWLEKKK